MLRSASLPNNGRTTTTRRGKFAALIIGMLFCIWALITTAIFERSMIYIMNADSFYSLMPQTTALQQTLSRDLPMVGGYSLSAEWILNSSNGSFWLPLAPLQLISGYQVKPEGNQFYTKAYNGRSGFVNDNSVEIMFSQTFNAGDFLAYWFAPMISGRRAFLNNDTKANRCALALVGSILDWGIRYAWGPGFIEANDKLSNHTEMVFALRGPVSYKQALQTKEAASTIAKVYGDVGSLISWYYQPHNQTKAFSLCLIPHYIDQKSKLVKQMLAKQPNTRMIDIMGPLFDIMDQIVQCEFVLSSTLHGIIFSDSYGIPNAHMILSHRVQGGDHKFQDYFKSVERPFESLNVTNFDLANENKSVSDFIRKNLDAYDVLQINLMPFWQSCPMHAEGYNRAREEHVKFARRYAKRFSQVLENRPKTFGEFREQIEKEFPL